MLCLYPSFYQCRQNDEEQIDITTDNWTNDLKSEYACPFVVMEICWEESLKNMSKILGFL